MNGIVPKVEVIDGGKKISSERIDPTVASFIMQSVQAVQLSKLRKLEESKIPIGTKTRVLDLTTRVNEYDISPPWISFTIANAGPDNAKISTLKMEGGHESEADIDPGQVLNFNFNFPVVDKIYLSSTGTCQVRIYAIEGVRNDDVRARHQVVKQLPAPEE